MNADRKTIRIPGETATVEQISEALRKLGLTIVELEKETA